MRYNVIIVVCLLSVTVITGCSNKPLRKQFNDLFTFREEQKPLVTPKPANFNTDNPERMQVPMPSGKHYSINEQNEQ